MPPSPALTLVLMLMRFLFMSNLSFAWDGPRAALTSRPMEHDNRARSSQPPLPKYWLPALTFVLMMIFFMRFSWPDQPPEVTMVPPSPALTPVLMMTLFISISP